MNSPISLATASLTSLLEPVLLKRPLLTFPNAAGANLSVFIAVNNSSAVLRLLPLISFKPPTDFDKMFSSFYCHN